MTTATHAPCPPTIDPPGDRWHGLVSGFEARDASIRAELGLPTSGRIVMTGHQAIVFHPGILAKYLAAEAFAESIGARCAWVVTDQDTPDPLVLQHPARTDAAVRREAVDLAPDQPRLAGVSVASQPAVPVASGGRFADVARAFAAHAAAPSLAAQTAGALGDLLGQVVRPAPFVRATALARTTLFEALLERMRAEPRACAEAYNHAIDAAGLGHDVRPLRVETGRVELPLWRLEWQAPRRGVFDTDLAGLDRAVLAPKALLMTAILRLGACDLFIHGTGGAGYDRVTELWIERWLDRPLAPATLVTATCLLDLGEPVVGEEAAARATWAAHHARHEPDLLGDRASGERKRALLGRLRDADRQERAGLFAELHALLARVRRERVDALEELGRAARRARAAAGSADVLGDRTWPFVLYPPEALAELRRSVRAGFGLRA